MFCPGCRAEYREGFTRCASCDLDLVEEKDLPPDQDQEMLSSLLANEPVPETIQVFESNDPFVVKAVVSLLEEQQIPFYLKNGDMGEEGFSPIFGGASSLDAKPARFLVSPDLEEKVLILLEDFQALPAEGAQEFVDLPRELAEATEEPDPEADQDNGQENEEDDEEDDEDSTDSLETIFCPLCGKELEISEEERLDGHFLCPSCGKKTELD